MIRQQFSNISIGRWIVAQTEHVNLQVAVGRVGRAFAEDIERRIVRHLVRSRVVALVRDVLTLDVMHVVSQIGKPT